MKNVGVLPSANAELQGTSVDAAFWSRDASNGATGQVSPKKLSDFFCLRFMMMDFFFSEATAEFLPQ
jgi:hypothetical protein